MGLGRSRFGLHQLSRSGFGNRLRRRRFAFRQPLLQVVEPRFCRFELPSEGICLACQDRYLILRDGSIAGSDGKPIPQVRDIVLQVDIGTFDAS